MKKTDYKALVHTDRELFDKLVTEYLNLGYQLHGSVKLSRNSASSYVYFIQAVVKYPKIKEQ